MKLLREGKSFSGHERNCVFLNCGQEVPFANVSAVSGLDFPDDGRAVAAVDWDHDGDLDLWFHNRTGPRLRFMRNRTINGNRKADDWVMLRLVGTSSNRDAIGARVRLHLSDPSAPPLQRTLSAGDGYLSQSSKWLHFGLSENQQIKEVLVRWPDGQSERIDGVQAGDRYVITEGTGTAMLSPARAEPIRLDEQTQAAPKSPTAERVLLANPVPLPLLRYTRQPQGPPTTIEATGRPMLIVFWASWCPTCLHELTDLTAHEQELRDAGLDVLALSVDAVAETSDAATNRDVELLRSIQFPFSVGAASSELLDKLEILQRVTLNQTPPLAVPTSLLVDAEGGLGAIYRGPISVPTLLADVERLQLPTARRRDFAVPFAGRWLSPPATLLMRPVGQVFQEAGYVEDYSRFLNLDRQAIAARRSLADDSDARLDLDQQYATATFNLARTLQLQGQLNQATEYYRQGMEAIDDSAPAHRYLADALVQQGQPEQAIIHYRRARQLDPSLLVTYNALARIHRTSGRHSESLAELRAALAMDADHVPTRFELGVTLDALGRSRDALAEFRAVIELQPNHADAWANLGSLLARAGRRSEAITALERAITLAPTNATARLGLAGALAASGDMRSAVEHFREVVRQQPELAVARVGLAQALMVQRKWGAAVAEFEHAIRLNPRDGGSILRLSRILATCPDDNVRNGARAVTLAERLAKATGGKDPRVLETLAAAYAEQGELRRAIAVVQRALRIVTDNDSGLRTSLQSQLQQYQRQ